MAIATRFDRTLNYYSSLVTGNLHWLVDAVEGLLSVSGADPIVATGAVDASDKAYGGTYTNDGAVVPSPISMGGATVGRKFRGIVLAAPTFSFLCVSGRCHPQRSDASNPGGSISSNVVGNRINLECFKIGIWSVGNQTGSWDLTQ